MKMHKIIDLTGQKFGDLEIIREINVPYERKNERRKTTIKLECKCICGTIFYPFKTNVLRKRTLHCKRCNRNYQFVGRKIGALTVLSKHYGLHKSAFLCRCDCGKEDIIQSRYLSKGKFPQVCKYCRYKRKFSDKPKLTREESIKQTNYKKHLLSKEKILNLRFLYFKVISFSHWQYTSKRRHAFYLCRCVCRRRFVVKGSVLVEGKQKSCGCKSDYAFGERQHLAKLKNAEVKSIKELLVSGIYTQREIAKMFGITETNLSNIACGRSYKGV